MKTYKIADLKRLAKEQDYKMAALEGPHGDRILNFNQIKKKIETQLDLIPTRLKAEINPDGVYFVLMAHNIQGSKSPHRYPIVKGNVKPEELAEIEKKSIPLSPVEIINNTPQVLTWAQALEYQQTIADLKAQVNKYEFENNELHKQIAELEADLDEQETLEEESQPNNTLTFLKEALPSLTPILDRYFETENRKLDLEELKLKGGGKSSTAGTKRGTERKDIVPGSQEHLSVIEYYYNKEMDAEMNRELDKLERANPETYLSVIQKLGLEEQGEEQQEEKGGSDA